MVALKVHARHARRIIDHECCGWHQVHSIRLPIFIFPAAGFKCSPMVFNSSAMLCMHIVGLLPRSLYFSTDSSNCYFSTKHFECLQSLSLESLFIRSSIHFNLAHRAQGSLIEISRDCGDVIVKCNWGCWAIERRLVCLICSKIAHFITFSNLKKSL